MKNFKDKYDVKLLEKEITKRERAKEIEDCSDGALEAFIVRITMKFIAKIDAIDEDGTIHYTFTVRCKRGLLMWLAIAPLVLLSQGIEDGIEDIVDLVSDKDVTERAINIREIFK